MNVSKKPPKGLSREAAGIWRSVVDVWLLEPTHLRLLEAACRQWDRAIAARKVLADRGLVMLDRFGQEKPHPMIDVERKALDAFRLTLRELGLREDGAQPGRPPRIAGRYVQED